MARYLTVRGWAVGALRSERYAYGRAAGGKTGKTVTTAHAGWAWTGCHPRAAHADTGMACKAVAASRAGTTVDGTWGSMGRAHRRSPSTVYRAGGVVWPHKGHGVRRAGLGRWHPGHTRANVRAMAGKNKTWYTGSANTMQAMCPGHVMASPPHVGHVAWRLGPGPNRGSSRSVAVVHVTTAYRWSSAGDRRPHCHVRTDRRTGQVGMWAAAEASATVRARAHRHTRATNGTGRGIQGVFGRAV